MQEKIKKIKILVAVPNLGNIRAELAVLFLNWAIDGRYQVKIWTPQHFIPLDYARNAVRKTFLEEGHDYLLTIDADVVPPVGVLELAALDFDVIAPICYIMKEEGIVPMALRKVDQGWRAVEELKINLIISVDCAGAGCLMIARRVLEKVPLFRFEYDSDGMISTDEAFSWSDRVIEAGFGIFVYTNLVCKHFKTVDLREVVKLLNKRVE